MKMKVAALSLLLTGCFPALDQYPARQPYIQKEIVLPDLTGYSEEEKERMRKYNEGKELIEVGAPMDLSRYDGSYGSFRRCQVDLARSNEKVKDMEICYSTVPVELRERYRLFDKLRRKPNVYRVYIEE
jgi:hypothetical protein